MVDFPNSPNEGDIHTEEGQVWTYRDGAWVVGVDGALVTEIAASDTATYQIWGDLLVQWGKATSPSSGTVNVTFPIAYEVEPTVTCSVDNDGSGIEITLTSNVSLTGAGFASITPQGTQVAGSDCNWMAIGPAPVAMRKPKSVLGGNADVVGGGPYFEADYQQGNNVVSYDIIGTTLRCWGIRTDVRGNAIKTINLPKAFADPGRYTIVLGLAGAAQTSTNQYTALNKTNTSFQLDNSTNTAGPAVSWLAIGEVDPSELP